MHSSSVLAGIPYKDILSVCFAVCPLKYLTFLQFFFLEDMICQDKYLFCYGVHSFLFYMKNVISSLGIS